MSIHTSRLARLAVTMACAGLLSLGFAGCGPVANAPGAAVQIRIENTTAFPVTLVVDGPGFSPLHATVDSHDTYIEEAAGSAGDIIGVDASGGGRSGSGTCRASSAIISGNGGQYGQINIIDTGSVLDVVCSSGWQ